MSYTHLPPAPEGLEYAHRKINNQEYLTTGLFMVGSPQHTKKLCKRAVAIVLDFDLVDHLEATTDLTKKEIKPLLYAAPQETLNEALELHLVEIRRALHTVLDADPTVLVCSGYGYHAYYWLDDTYRLSKVQEVNKSIALQINSLVGYPLADPKAVNTGELITRPPGTFNTKGKTPQAVQVIQRDPAALFPLPALPSSVTLPKELANSKSIPTQETDWTLAIIDPSSGTTLQDLAHTLNQGDKHKLACPFHDGSGALSGFLQLDPSGLPYLHCSSEGITYRPSSWGSKDADLALMDQLDKSKGKPQKTFKNLLRILRGDPSVPQYYYDIRRQEIYRGDQPLEDIDLLTTKIWLAETYLIEPSKELILEAISIIANANKRNPLTEWLDRAAINTDPRGEELLNTWLPEVIGCTNNQLHRAYSRKFLLSAVARAYNPGCRVDTMLTIIGPQGAGKSSLFQMLTPLGYFSDTHLDLSSKDSYQQLSRAWVYEISELSSFNRREHEQIKAWISSKEDTYRPPYSRLPVTRPRHTVLVATSNDDSPLTDLTGSRRYWVVTCGPQLVKSHILEDNLEALWGAAVRAYQEEEIWYLTQEEEGLRRVRADHYKPESPYHEPVSKVLHNHKDTTITISEICESLNIPTQSRYITHKQLPAVLRDLGAGRLARRRVGGKRITEYLLPGEPLPYGASFDTPEEEERHTLASQEPGPKLVRGGY